MIRNTLSLNQQQPKEKESIATKKNKSNVKPLADLIRQINQANEKVKSNNENPWQPKPPLAA